MAVIRSQRGVLGTRRGAMASRQRVMTRSAGRSTGESPEQKAVWHAVQGAGKARTVRNFFDLNEARTQQLVNDMQALMIRRLQQP